MSLNVLIDPYMSTVTNLVKSVETYSFAFGFGGNSTTANNSGILGSLPVLFVQYLLTAFVTQLTVLPAFDTSLFCKSETLASTLRLLDIRFILNVFKPNEGVLVLCLMPIRLLFTSFFAKAMFHQANSLFVTESKIGTSTAVGAQNNCVMGSLWKDS